MSSYSRRCLAAALLSMSIVFLASNAAADTFDTVGTHTYTVPAGAQVIKIEAWGAQGGSTSASGGRGAYASGRLPVSPGDEFEVQVGESGGTGTGSGGWPNGGNGNSLAGGSGGGGGASQLLNNNDVRIVIAAGGGGAGAASGGQTDVAAGGSGGQNGSFARASDGCLFGGTAYVRAFGGESDSSAPGEGGGTSSSGCSSASGNTGNSASATPRGVGADGTGQNTLSGGQAASGGGGGGYFGGGAGGAIAGSAIAGYTATAAGGGGGGSSYVDSALFYPSISSGVQDDNGKVVIVVSDWVDPNKPKNPGPADGGVVRTDSTTISANYTDPGGLDGTMTFYDASDDSEIGSCSVQHMQRCGVTWSDYSHGENDWYVNATNDDGKFNVSDTWTLVKNQPPEVDQLIRPKNGVMLEGNDTILRAEVSDPNSGDKLAVRFYNNKTGEVALVDQVNAGPGSTSYTVEGTWNSGDLNHGGSNWWHVNVSDPWEQNVSKNNASFYVNTLPSIIGIEPDDNGFSAGSGPADMEVEAADQESNTVHVYFFNASDDTPIGKGTSFNGGPAEAEWSGLNIGDTYSWYVKASDGQQNYTSPVWTFDKLPSPNYRPIIGLQHRYSSIITSLDSGVQFAFSLENTLDATDKDLNISLHGVNAHFVRNDKSWIRQDIPAESERRFQVRIDPQTSGNKELEVRTENQDLGLVTSKKIPVHVMENPSASAGNEVPGIGLIQLLVITFTALALYSV